VNTCSTCAFWKPSDGIYSPEQTKECTSPKFFEWEGQPQTDDCLVYPYSEGGTFYTGPNFGCVHHTRAAP
jgi:hypothetical protein